MQHLGIGESHLVGRERGCGPASELRAAQLRFVTRARLGKKTMEVDTSRRRERINDPRCTLVHAMTGRQTLPSAVFLGIGLASRIAWISRSGRGTQRISRVTAQMPATWIRAATTARADLRARQSRVGTGYTSRRIGASWTSPGWTSLPQNGGGGRPRLRAACSARVERRWVQQTCSISLAGLRVRAAGLRARLSLRDACVDGAPRDLAARDSSGSCCTPPSPALRLRGSTTPRYNS